MSHPSTQDFLFELLTEELPPKAMPRLSAALEDAVVAGLQSHTLAFEGITSYATPRRLAFVVHALQTKQDDQESARKGPAITAAFDADGQPTKACLGFAASCGVDVSELSTQKTEKGEWVSATVRQKGKVASDCLPDIIQQALSALPIPKRMRWGAHETPFVRPVQGVVMLLGETVVPAQFFEFNAGRETKGHRFLCASPIVIQSPASYEEQLANEGFVIASFEKRRDVIRQQIHAKVEAQFSQKARAVIDDALLDEVTAIVEWPVALMASFDNKLLSVPKEALISAMQDHQKSFPLEDNDGKLLPHFITISNLISKNPDAVIHGNERVMRARLEDASFFYHTDSKTPLASRVESLKQVTYQAALGSLWDKTMRVKTLAAHIAADLDATSDIAVTGAELAKADLVSDMVGEFPELQGTMGYYYALHDGLSPEVATVIKEHYFPRFAKDSLPSTKEAASVALADRLDTLVGIFGIGKAPTGDKDPFGLRRAASGVIRILLELRYPLSLKKLITEASNAYEKGVLTHATVVEDVLNFCQERFRSFVLENHMTPDVFYAVNAIDVATPLSAYERMQAVKYFKTLPDAEALAAANKRVTNILKKGDLPNGTALDADLFEHETEKQLAHAIAEKQTCVEPLISKGDYQAALTLLAELRPEVDQFFDDVMVMVDDARLRKNRLILLTQLRQLFLQVADIALLQ